MKAVSGAPDVIKQVSKFKTSFTPLQGFFYLSFGFCEADQKKARRRPKGIQILEKIDGERLKNRTLTCLSVGK